ncbi:8002_t:CDS:2 [Cetraspora pellucida]|uniref:8002_t:CDS:1 n=1 Tax=Cetraspora pellucida TaxID=1433469 RepID=A0A9N8ZLZ4_9GLOM|nr:8002_t:CDS:2 [Cetraspora pellucida]
MKLKDGESTGWIKVIKKPTSKMKVASRRVTAKPRSNNPVGSRSNTLVESPTCNLAEPRLSNLVEPQSSNVVAVDPQTNADNKFNSNGLQTSNFVAIKSQQRLTKPKSRITLKQSSLSEFFQLENKFENNHLNIAKEVNISRQSQVFKPPEKKQSSRKRKDIREETTGKYIKQGQNQQITLTMCFENDMNFYAQFKTAKEKSNTSKSSEKSNNRKNSEKRNNRGKKAKSVRTNNAIDKNEKIQKKLVDFFLLKNQHTTHSQNTIIASELQNLPNSASVNGSTALDVNHLESDLSQDCYNNSPDELNGAKSTSCFLISKKCLAGSNTSYWQNRDDQQMPLSNSYHLSNLSVLTDDSFITTSSRVSSEITPDRHSGKSSKNNLCDSVVHDRELKKGSSAQISNIPLQSNVNPLLEMDSKRLVSMQNNLSLVAASKSVSRRMASPDKHCKAKTNGGASTKIIHESQRSHNNFHNGDDLDSTTPSRNTNVMVQNEILDVSSTQKTLFLSGISPSSLLSESRIIGEMDHQNVAKEILRSRTPDSIQERLIKSGISPAPSPPSLLSQDALEQISLSTLPSLDICTLQFDDFDDLLS